MLDHNQIESLMLYVDPDTKNAVGTSKQEPRNMAGQFVAFGPRVTPDAALFNLLVAAPMLYQQLTLQYQALQGLIDLIDNMPQTEDGAKLARSFIELQNGCLLAQRVAQVGIEEVSKTLDAGSKSS